MTSSLTAYQVNQSNPLDIGGAECFPFNTPGGTFGGAITQNPLNNCQFIISQPGWYRLTFAVEPLQLWVVPPAWQVESTAASTVGPQFGTIVGAEQAVTFYVNAAQAAAHDTVWIQRIAPLTVGVDFGQEAYITIDQVNTTVPGP
jgi:hypothetical protein